MSLLTVALIKTALVAAAAAAVTGAEPPDPKSVKSWKAEGLPESKAVGATPVTLKVVADDELTKALAAAIDTSGGGKGTVRLTLAGLAPADPKVGVKVYVNVPERDPLPAADSDYYVGQVGAFGKSEKADYAVDLAPALRKLAAKKAWAAGDPITIRLVAAPVNPRQPVREPKVTLDRVTVEVP